MKTYFRQRLLLLLPTLVGMTALAFALGFISPSDPAAVIMTMDGVTAPTPEEIAAKRVELGLDRPYAVQYAAWLGGVLRGDWGVSFITGKNVLQELLQALPVTLSLAGMALLWVILLSVPLGAVMAVYRHGAAERWLTLLSIALTSLPSFWLAIVLMQILC
ncbi:MAG: ABC transporter permease, partial [Selenomonas artemidis]